MTCRKETLASDTVGTTVDLILFSPLYCETVARQLISSLSPSSFNIFIYVELFLKES